MPLLIFPMAAFLALAPFVNMNAPVISVLTTEDIVLAAAFVVVGVEVCRNAVPTPRTPIRLIADLALLLVSLLEWFLPWTKPSGTLAVLTTATCVNLISSGFVAFVVKGQNNVWISKR